MDSALDFIQRAEKRRAQIRAASTGCRFLTRVRRGAPHWGPGLSSVRPGRGRCLRRAGPARRRRRRRGGSAAAGLPLGCLAAAAASPRQPKAGSLARRGRSATAACRRAAMAVRELARRRAAVVRTARQAAGVRGREVQLQGRRGRRRPRRSA